MDPRGFQIANYRIVSRLGAGGMGEVWLAQGDTGAAVVKTILPELAEDRRFVEMFLREAKIASLVQSPHVVAVREVGRAENTYFLALEYVEGLSLHRLLSLYGGPLPPKLAALVAAQAAQGLHHIHQQRSLEDAPLGIVHRDVSPGNLLISVEGCVKLTDFGIAVTKDRSLFTHTTIGSVRGKIPYMSPEQSKGLTVDHRTDVFGLGVVLYEMLSGELPYPGQMPDLQLMQAVATGQRRRLDEVDPHIPRPLLHIVDRALQTVASERYASAEAMAAELNGFLGAEAPAVREELAALVKDLGPGRAKATSAAAPPAPMHTRDLPVPAPAAAPAARARPWALLGVGAALVVALGVGLWRPWESRAPAAPKPAPAPVPAPSAAEVQARAEPLNRAPDPEPEPELAAAVTPPEREEPPPRRESALDRYRRKLSRKVRIESTPACDVWVNGRNLGRSPITTSVLPRNGRVRLISRENGINYEVALAPGQAEQSITVPRGTLHIRIDPYSEVTIDGRPLGEGPYEVLNIFAGRHELLVVNRELKVKRRVYATVAPNEERVFRLKLP